MKNTVTVFAIILFILAFATVGYAASESVSVKVSVTIPPLFELSVSGPTKGNIEFGIAERDPLGPVTVESQEVVLTAKSNLRRPYEITHALVTPLSNERNDRFAEKDLTVFAENFKTSGRAVRGTSVGTTSSAIYTSDPEGKSETVKANYRLLVRPQQAAGHYQTKLVYTITTI